MAGTVWSNNNAPFYDIEIENADGTPPAAAVVTAIHAAVEPTANIWQVEAIAAQPGVGRNVVIDVVDANSSMTTVTYEIIGLDTKGRGQEETITDGLAGTRLITGTKMFKTLTTVRHYVTGTVTGAADTVSAGYGDRVELPYDIEETTDIWSRREDGNAGVGTIDADNQAWILSGGNKPDGINRYFVTGRATVGE